MFQHLAPARLRGRGSTAGHARCEHELWRAHCPAVRSARPEGEGAFALGALGPGPPTLVLLFAFALQLLYRETKGPRRLEMRPRSGEPSGLNPGPGPAGKVSAAPAARGLLLAEQATSSGPRGSQGCLVRGEEGPKHGTAGVRVPQNYQVRLEDP